MRYLAGAKMAMVAAIFLALAAPSAMAGESAMGAWPLLTRITAIEATPHDIGEPRAVFDLNPATVYRSAGINPAHIRVEFDAPIPFELLRLRFHTDAPAVWSVWVADSIGELRERLGECEKICDAVETRAVDVEHKLPCLVTAKALMIEVRDATANPYVHLFELQLCVPGEISGLRVERYKTRTYAHAGATAEPIGREVDTFTDTVLWFRADLLFESKFGEWAITPSEPLNWACRGDGISPWDDHRNTPGMFHVTTAGRKTVTVSSGEFSRDVRVNVAGRQLENRERDLDVWFIERLPRIDYDGPNGGWPAEGSRVTWRAHVYNWGTRPVRAKYEWRLDGEVVAEGQIRVPAGYPSLDALPVEWQWEWQQKRHELTFHIATTGNTREQIQKNNTLTIATDALMVGFWVERSLWEHFHDNQFKLPTKDSNGFHGWGQRVMRIWNEMFAAAVYAEFPEGIRDRVRLDRVIIVPDFSLPLAGGLPSNNPDPRDKTIDMQWGFDSADVYPGCELPADHWWSIERAIRGLSNGDVAAKRDNPPAWCALGYIHELCHARYLVDVYGMNVHAGPGPEMANRTIQITDEHGPIFGRYMPANLDMIHAAKYNGQMSGDYWSFSAYEAMNWNRIAGKRASAGTCNAPGNIGEFLQEMPAKWTVQFVDETGRALAGCDVRVYRAKRPARPEWYTKIFAGDADIEAHADAEGRVSFDRTIFAADGKIVHTYGFSNAVCIVRVTHQGQHYFLFEEVTDFNMAHFFGHREHYECQRQIRLRRGDPDPSEWNIHEQWQVPGTEFGRRAPR